MCHLILLMPIVALPVFWLFPLSMAGPLYALVFALSVLLYVAIFRIMRKPPETGMEGMIHASGVVERIAGENLTVRIHGEHWMAHHGVEQLAPGDRVEVVGIDGLTLRVARVKD